MIKRVIYAFALLSSMSSYASSYSCVSEAINGDLLIGGSYNVEIQENSGIVSIKGINSEGIIGHINRPNNRSRFSGVTKGKSLAFVQTYSGDGLLIIKSATTEVWVCENTDKTPPLPLDEESSI